MTQSRVTVDQLGLDSEDHEDEVFGVFWTELVSACCAWPESQWFSSELRLRSCSGRAGIGIPEPEVLSLRLDDDDEPRSGLGDPNPAAEDNLLTLQ